MTTYKDITSTFESITASKREFAEGLEYQWFLNALGEYELNIGSLGYDYDTKEFTGKNPELYESNGELKSYVILTLAQIMKSYHVQKEVRRVNLLNNIVGKDISLNGTGDTKKYTSQEADTVKSAVEDLYNKQKCPAYT